MRVSLEMKSCNSKVCGSNAGILGTITRNKQGDHNIEENTEAKTGSVPSLGEGIPSLKSPYLPRLPFYLSCHPLVFVGIIS